MNKCSSECESSKKVRKDFGNFNDQMKAIKDDLKMSGNLNKGSKGSQGFRLLKKRQEKGVWQKI